MLKNYVKCKNCLGEGSVLKGVGHWLESFPCEDCDGMGWLKSRQLVFEKYPSGLEVRLGQWLEEVEQEIEDYEKKDSAVTSYEEDCLNDVNEKIAKRIRLIL